MNIYDYFNLESELTEEAKKVQSEIRQWVKHQFSPEIESFVQQHRTNLHWFHDLAALGCLGAQLSTQYGGSDWSYLSYGVAMQELEKGDSCLRTMASVQGALVIHAIERFGTSDQKAKFLPALVKGQMIGCFGLTEQNHGSNPAGMESFLEYRSGQYYLSGNKAWITNGSIAQIGIIWAKNEENHIVAVLLDMDKKGVSRKTIEDKWSLRAANTAHLTFDAVPISSTEVLPQAKGLKSALQCLNKARYGIAWGAVGAAMNCFETALLHVQGRTQFGQPLAKFQLVQKKLAEMLTKIVQGQLMNFQLARLGSQGVLTAGQISMAKRSNVSMALEIAREARQMMGAEGLRSGSPIMRHLMNLETVITYEGSHDIHLLITGQEITGLSAFV